MKKQSLQFKVGGSVIRAEVLPDALGNFVGTANVNGFTVNSAAMKTEYWAYTDLRKKVRAFIRRNDKVEAETEKLNRWNQGLPMIGQGAQNGTS